MSATTTKQPTAKMTQAVKLRDEGLTNAQIGERMGVTAGTAGNYVTEGLRRMGREAEVSQDTGSRAPSNGGKPAATSGPVAMIETAIAQLDDRIKAWETKVSEVRAEAETDEGSIREALLDRRRSDVEQLTKLLAEAQAEVEAFDENAEALVAAEVEARKDRLTKTVEQSTGEIEQLTKTREQQEAALVAVKAALGETA